MVGKENAPQEIPKRIDWKHILAITVLSSAVSATVTTILLVLLDCMN